MDSRFSEHADWHDDCAIVRDPLPGTPSNRTRILAYLGELKSGQFVPVKKLIHDLDLRFTTAKNILGRLEEEWLVEKRITTRNGTAASFRISPTATTQQQIGGAARATGLGQGVEMTNQQHQELVSAPYVPPEWSAEYGKHPYGT